MADMTLRKAAQTDAAALGSLHVASWHETYTGTVPDEMLAGLWVSSWRRVTAANCLFG